MLVTRVEAEVPITSFRYPYFMVGMQPTYVVPPLSTLYGHLCSAAGYWVPSDGVRIGVAFQYEAIGEDLEHQILLEPTSGRLWKGGPRKVMQTPGEGVVPVRRQFLFNGHLTLYVSGDWRQAFMAPRYPAVLGRSQDLVSYTMVTLLELQTRPDAYYEHTLLPWSLRPVVVRARTEHMTRWIDLEHGRRAYFDQFLVITDRVFTTSPADWIRYEDQKLEHLVDPTSPVYRGLNRGVWMHSLQPAQ